MKDFETLRMALATYERLYFDKRSFGYKDEDIKFLIVKTLNIMRQIKEDGADVKFRESARGES